MDAPYAPHTHTCLHADAYVTAYTYTHEDVTIYTHDYTHFNLRTKNNIYKCLYIETGKRFGIPVCGINFVSCQIYSRLVTFFFKSHLDSNP